MIYQASHLIAGKNAEQLAERFLKDKGFKLLDRNFRCKPGEIDLIMVDNESLVFIEVRYRQNTSFGLPEETVTYAKQKRLGKAAACYLNLKSISDKYACRFDIVAIHGTIPNHTINWISNAFYTST